MIRKFKIAIKFLISPKFKYLKRFSVGKGDIVVDLGANVGEVSEYFLARGATVDAYEPNPHAFAVLEQRVGNNSRATLNKMAVSDHCGTASLWLYEQHQDDEVKFSQASSLKSEKENVSEDCVTVEVTDISKVLQKHDHIKLLKIDIEGGEYDIMDQVMENESRIDYILLETHEKKNRAFREKNDQMLKSIKEKGLENKIYLDWF
ncbi:MAG: FkbM family methyltransferase [Cohaesibacter sp.]|nr:FkbM family methyltransferase [Cohaesibacter sp.]